METPLTEAEDFHLDSNVLYRVEKYTSYLVFIKLFESIQLMRWIVFCLVIGICAILFCEYVSDILFLQKCNWPVIKAKKYNVDPLRAMILADPHLGGPHHNGWYDKIYREWHMKRSFQTSIRLFQPDVVFILGDLFDEGNKLNNKQFREHMKRYLKIFNLPPGIPLISLPGNHDVGFHYRLHPFIMGRFGDYFEYSLVHLYTIKDIHFVLINSMVLEMDGCIFCAEAELALKNISKTLNCMKDPMKKECTETNYQIYSRPILLQHIPTYRISDEICIEHDAPKIEQFYERIHVISKDTTDMLGVLLNPRLSFAGHSHHYCHSVNRLGIDEFTVASFSWRNKDNPSFLMASITPDDYKIAKCSILSQQFVHNCYCFAVLLCLILIIYPVVQWMTKRRHPPEDDDRKEC